MLLPLKDTKENHNELTSKLAKVLLKAITNKGKEVVATLLSSGNSPIGRADHLSFLPEGF